MNITVRRLASADRPTWLQMREALYGGENPTELAAEISRMLASDDWAAFGAAANGRLVGMIELFERNHADGCTTSPVTYIEGLWVAEDCRRRGVARELVRAGIEWGRSRGRTEMASDVRFANVLSQTVHRSLGFEETERLVIYRMSIGHD